VLEKEKELAEAKPEVNPWACLILLTTTVALMAVTAKFVRLTLVYFVVDTHAER